ncbi:MAG: hypothetical protein JJT96_11695 [Opitutales bacterium]|nr:hypothetical protein [Opitutales bacterium]
MTTTHQTYRHHPQLQALFKTAESRHLNDEEMRTYLSVVPDETARAQAAREVKNVDGGVVKKTIKGIYEIYPYEQKHALAMAKCVRDVRYVTAYATMAMLMDDPDWFRDKLLVWMKTIIQSFRYPDIPEGTTRRLHSDPEILAHLETLQPHQRSIYETYMSVKREIMASISETSAEIMEPFLQLPVDILAHD